MRISSQPGPAADTAPFQPSRRSLLRTATVAGLATAPAVLGADLAFAGTAIGTVGPLQLPEATEQITPLHINVPEVLLKDLRHRLASVRLPERETVDDASQGVQLAKQISLLQYWRTRYDWRRFERKINITLYWLTDTAASSARIYWQNYGASGLTKLDLPVGLSVFPHELVRSPRIWAERAYSDLVYFNDQIRYGGHFAAFEQPQLFAEEVRKFTRLVK